MYKKENIPSSFSGETSSIKKSQSIQFKNNRSENITQLKVKQMAKKPPKRSKAPSFSTLDGWRVVTNSKNYATSEKIRYVREKVPANKKIINKEENEYLNALNQTRNRSERAKAGMKEGDVRIGYLESNIEEMDSDEHNFNGLTIQEAKRRTSLRNRFNSGSVKWNTIPDEKNNNATFTSTDSTYQGHIHRNPAKTPGNAWVKGIKYFELSMNRYKNILQKYVSIK